MKGVGETKTNCEWCEAPIPAPSRRGSPQRFCSSECRNAFHVACGRYTAALVTGGYLTSQNLRRWAGESVDAFTDVVAD